MSSQVKVGALFGLGRAGKIHYASVQSLRTAARIKYIVDADTAAAAAYIGADWPSQLEILHPDDEDRVMRDPEVAFCIVCSPTLTHEAVIHKCIASGKQIFCEKPVATGIQAMRECYRLAEANGLLLHCSYNRRFDPSFNLLKKRISDTCGAVHTVRTCSRDSPLPALEYLRTSGGIYHDCGVHDLDMVCWLMGEWPSSVFATGACHDSRLREFDDHDTAVVVLNFPSGGIGLIELSRHSTYGYDQRIEVHGINGMVASNNVCDRAVTTSTAAGVSSANIQHSFPQRYAEAYVNSMRCFLALMSGDREAQTISPLESVNVSSLADLCQMSAKSGSPMKFSPVTSL